jgi:predicted Ser/Thr protein kinase
MERSSNEHRIIGSSTAKLMPAPLFAPASPRASNLTSRMQFSEAALRRPDEAIILVNTMDDPITSQTATVAAVASGSGSATSLRLSTAVADEGRFVPGTVVAGRYRIISLLGRGGMGEVYRATDLTLAQPVALKFLPESGPEFQRTLERFHNEVRVARQVSHPNVCRVYDLGEVDGVPYISMEYVDGEDLESLLHRIGRLPADKAIEIARKICAGVAAAHDKGVIHRDLKPANIMLDKRGNVVVMDFGLAAVADQLQGSEVRSGTPAYMAPEQLRGEEVTAKSDIYALGLVLYELFTGKRAYEAKSQVELVRMQENAEITSMSSIAAEIEPTVEKAIRRCLDPEPSRRPATALVVSASLPGGDPLAAALAAGETPSPELVAASGKTEGLPLKRSAPMALALAALVIAVPFLRHNTELHSFVPMDLGPEALAAKVREHAASFGYTSKPADSKYDPHWDAAIVWEARKASKSLEAFRVRLDAEPPMQLGYRESPLPLVARPDGEVTGDRPAPTLSGMIEAWVNSKGELRRFLAVPSQAKSGSETVAIDPAILGRATGFDLARWQETAPTFTPLYAFDWQKAWKGKHPRLGLDIAVQASAWRGRLTEVYVIWPWSEPWRMPGTNTRSASDWIRLVVLRVTSAVVFLFSAFLAARNLRAGRGDRRGAGRLAVAFLLSTAVAGICTVHWTMDIAMADILSTNAGSWFTAAALIWLLYIALEPAVRARWPHALVTWSRVLAGRWQDPLVGAHVLYGALAGLLIAYLFVGNAQWDALDGKITAIARPEVGMSARYWVADVLRMSWEGVEAGLVVVFAIFCLRVLFKRDWIASIAMALLLTAREGDVWQNATLVSFVAYAAIFAVLAFVLLRMGLVSSIVAIFFVNLLTRTPGFQNMTKWYEWSVVAYPALALAIVIWAFWRTSGEEALTSGLRTE